MTLKQLMDDQGQAVLAAVRRSGRSRVRFSHDPKLRAAWRAFQAGLDVVLSRRIQRRTA
jgi:hypothetical protein